MKPRRLRSGRVVVGQTLSESIFDENGRLILRGGSVITPDDVQRLSNKFDFRYDPDAPEPLPVPVEEAPSPKTIDRTESPFEQFDTIQFRLTALFKNIAVEKRFMSRITSLTAMLEDICKNDEDLALGMIMLEHQARYSIKHHLHTAIVCNIIAKKLGWPQQERVSLTAAALTMNISMLELQDKLHYQKGPLSEHQRNEIQRHPAAAAQMIQKLGVTDEMWCAAVLQHHEMLDGSGYPNNLKESEIIPAARVLSLGNIYCARVSGRDYRPPLSPSLAMKEIFLNGKVDADLGMLFIKTLGIYPPGTFVRLKNNEIAVVTQRGKRIYCPIVHTVLRSNGTVPLAPPCRDTSADEYSITQLIPAVKAGIDVNRCQLWGYGVFRRSKTLKRKKDRAPISVPAKLLDMRTITIADATIINISEGGCMFKVLPEAGKDFHVNMAMNATFKILDFIVENVDVVVKNIHEKRDLIENYNVLLVGVQFMDISQRYKDYIRSFLMSIE